MNDENFGLKKTLSIKIEELNPSFLNNDIMSVSGDDRRLTFKIKYQEKCYFVECQIKEFNPYLFHAYIIIKDYDLILDLPLYIETIKQKTVDTENEVIKYFCKYLNERFPS